MTELTDEQIAARLDELAIACSKTRSEGGDWQAEFTMSIPARPGRDADLVMSEAARRLRAGHRAAMEGWMDCGVVRRSGSVCLVSTVLGEAWSPTIEMDYPVSYPAKADMPTKFHVLIRPAQGGE